MSADKATSVDPLTSASRPPPGGATAPVELAGRQPGRHPDSTRARSTIGRGARTRRRDHPRRARMTIGLVAVVAIVAALGVLTYLSSSEPGSSPIQSERTQASPRRVMTAGRVTPAGLLANPCGALTDTEVMTAYGIGSAPPTSFVDQTVDAALRGVSCRWTIHQSLFLEVRVLRLPAAGMKAARDAEARAISPTGLAPDSFKRTDYPDRTNPPINLWIVYRDGYRVVIDGCSNVVFDEDMRVCDHAASQLGPIVIRRISG